MLFVIVFFYFLIKLSNRNLKYRFLSLLKLNQFILREKFVKRRGWYLFLTLFQDRAFAPASCFPKNFGVPKSHFSNQTFLQVIPKLRFPAMSATIIIALQARVSLETLRGAAISSILFVYPIRAFLSSSLFTFPLLFPFNSVNFGSINITISRRWKGNSWMFAIAAIFIIYIIIKFYEEIFKNFTVYILNMKETKYNFSSMSAYLVYRLLTKFNRT